MSDVPTSKYKGLHWDIVTRKWRVEITKDGKRYKLGRFKCEIEAAKAYNTKALELYGSEAKLNEITI